MTGVLPVILALCLLALSQELPAGVPGMPLIQGLVLSLAAWTVLMALLHRLVLTFGFRAWLRVADEAGVAGALAMHAWWCLDLGWGRNLPGHLLGLAPFILAWLIHQRVLIRTLAGLGQTSPLLARAGVINRLRFGMLPSLLLVGLLDLLVAGGEHLHAYLVLRFPAQADLLLLLGLAGGWLLLPVLVLSAAPPLLGWIWGARTMPPGPLLDTCQAAAAALRVRPGRFMLWPTGPVPFFNAAVVGLLPWPRRVFFSHDLLTSLTTEAFLAVLGHELGHVKHGHAWRYLCFFYAALPLASHPSLLLAWGALLGPEGLGLNGSWALAIGTVLGLLALLRLGFGMLSRQCEREADQIGARLAGIPAMQTALAVVAEQAGIAPGSPNWRHHSIAARLVWLERIAAQPELAQAHHRRARLVGWSLVVLLVLSPLSWGFGRGDGATTLEQLAATDAALAQAVSAAKAGDSSTWERLLLAAAPARRRQLGLATLHSMPERPAEAWVRRGLVIPFTRLGTQDPHLDRELANLVAYILVTGPSDPPSPADLDLASRLADGLVQSGASFDHIQDTIGCVRFMTGRRAEAATHFARAAALLPPSDPQRNRLRVLYQARLQAARSPDAPLPPE